MESFKGDQRSGFSGLDSGVQRCGTICGYLEVAVRRSVRNGEICIDPVCELHCFLKRRQDSFHLIFFTDEPIGGPDPVKAPSKILQLLLAQAV
jgi:hypothetical protein